MADAKDLISRARAAAAGENVTYPSRVAARQIRDLVGELADALEKKPRRKGIHIGAPACFALEIACKTINDAFKGFGCYVVGSVLERPDWRDVDVRFIMADADFDAEFPGTRERGIWEFDAKWLLLTVSISAWLSKQTGLPIDFQFQPQGHANDHHKGRRNAIGLKFAQATPESK